MFRLNPFRADLTGWIGAGIMIAFATVAGLRWHSTGLLFFGLTLLRDLIAAVLLLTRRAPCSGISQSLVSRALAYVSSAIPLLYFAPVATPSSSVRVISDFLVIAGYALSALAMIELGSSFGVSPANRGRVTSGVYRTLRNPMYVGYAISEMGLALVNPMNRLLFLGSLTLYGIRAIIETRTLRTIPYR